MNDRPSFRNAVTWAYVMTVGQRGISTLLTVVLAAILGPRDFGLVAMALAYIIFIEMFVAQGMSAAIIQRRDLKRRHLDSVFWLTLAGSLVMTAASIALGPWWAAVNKLSELTPVIAVLSLSVPLKGLTVVQRALLQRRMEFRGLALLGGASALAGGAVGVTMAVCGCGVWSLVAQQLVGSAVATALMWRISDWRPRLRFSWRHARELLGFSGGVFASHLGVYTAGQSDAILMGIFFGPVAVGLYRLAERMLAILLEVTTRPIQTVALPHFSRLVDQPDDLRRGVLTCIRLSAIVAIPALVVTAAAGDQLMAVLGPQWAPAADVLKVVVFVAVAKAVVLFSGPLLLARGLAKSIAALTWIPAVLTAGVIALVGLELGNATVELQIVAVAVARTGVYLIFGGVLRLVVVRIMTRFSMGQLAASLGPGIGAALSAVGTSAAISATGVPSSLPPVAALLLVAGPAAVAATVTLLALDQTARQTIVPRLRCMLPGAGPRPLSRENIYS
jgi:PST family polysaccharide transporter